MAGHVRKGDTVVVIAGSHKGKRGKVLRMLATKKGTRIVVEKVALVKRHTKPSQKNPQGGIVDKEGSIHISNVQLWDDKHPRRVDDRDLPNGSVRTELGGGTRTKNIVDGDSRVRAGIKSGTKFPTAGM